MEIKRVNFAVWKMNESGIGKKTFKSGTLFAICWCVYVTAICLQSTGHWERRLCKQKETKQINVIVTNDHQLVDATVSLKRY